jgi:hypothetical protein
MIIWGEIMWFGTGISSGLLLAFKMTGLLPTRWGISRFSENFIRNYSTRLDFFRTWVELICIAAACETSSRTAHAPRRTGKLTNIHRS